MLLQGCSAANLLPLSQAEETVSSQDTEISTPERTIISLNTNIRDPIEPDAEEALLHGIFNTVAPSVVHIRVTQQICLIHQMNSTNRVKAQVS